MAEINDVRKTIKSGDQQLNIIKLNTAKKSSKHTRSGLT